MGFFRFLGLVFAVVGRYVSRVSRVFMWLFVCDTSQSLPDELHTVVVEEMVMDRGGGSVLLLLLVAAVVVQMRDGKGREGETTK